MKKLLLFLTLICFTVFFQSCSKSEEDCEYIQYTGSGNCSNGEYPVENDCCPDGYPFYCTKTKICYVNCVLAAEKCRKGTVYKYNKNSGGTGNCSGSYQSPTPNDAQLDALCQAAYTYRCGGYDSQADLTCQQYNSLANTGTNVPRCSYCN